MDIQEFVQRSENMTHTYKVTSDIYYGFQRCSGDFNPLHTDESWARQKGFSGQVMYGNILNAFISHFVGMLLPSRNVMIQSQDIAFHRPVYLNDEIRLEAVVDTVCESVNVVVYKLKFVKPGGVDSNQLVAKGHVQVGILSRNRI